MNDIQYEDHKSDLFYRVKYVSGENAADTTRKDYHYSENYILIYFKSGAGNIHINGMMQSLSPGDVVLLNPSELFLFNVEDGCYHERIVLFVNVARLSLFHNKDHRDIYSVLYETGGGAKALIPAETVKSQGLDRAFHELLNAVRDKGPYGPPLTSAKAIEILCLTKKMLENIPNTLVNHAQDAMITAILGYLHEHHRENICIEDIAAYFKVHRSYLLHKFKGAVGISLWNYVILQRIYTFNNLITQNGSIEETAYRVGFTNYSNFYRLYKKHMGITPLEFKQRLKG